MENQPQPEPKSSQEGQEKIRKSLLSDLENRTPEERLEDLRRNASGSVKDKPQPEPKSIAAFQEINRQAMLANRERSARMTHAERIAEGRRNNSRASTYNPEPKSIAAFQEDSRLAVLESGRLLARMSEAERTAAFRRHASMPTIHDDVKVLLYLVFAIPIPGSKKCGIVSRYDGYFFCLADNPDPIRLLSELLAKQDAEILVAHHAATGEIGCLRDGAANRDQIIESGYALVLGKKVTPISPEQRYVKKLNAKKGRS